MTSIDRSRTRSRDIIWFLLILSVLLAARYLGLDFSALFNEQGINYAASLSSGLLKPDVDSQYLIKIFYLSLESILIGVLGTVIGVTGGIALAVGAAHLPDIHKTPGKASPVRTTLNVCLRYVFHFLLAVFRTVPDLVWAVLLVMLFGLGPGAAVLALAIITCGITGKLFAEIAETTDPELLTANRALGMKNTALWWHCVLPQLKRQWMAYALFRMECNIRNSTILGFVGAGGLGSEIALSIKNNQFAQLSTALIAVLIIVILLEIISTWLRQRPLKYSLWLVISVAGLALIILDIPWASLFDGSSLSIHRLAMSTPDGLISTALLLTFETILMAWCATIVAALFALLISPIVARTLHGGNYLKDTYQNRGFSYWTLRLTQSLFRLVFQIVRSIPEITFALIFVVWVGVGPLAGIMAIGIHTFGVLGRLYSDVYEEVEPDPAAALQSSGLKQSAVWLFAVLPQIFPRLMAFTLYRFEVNIRVTAVVGFVGAGGIGDAIHTAISLFFVGELIVLLTVMFMVVVLVDFVGRRIRISLLNRHYISSSIPDHEKPNHYLLKKHPNTQ